jgi:ribulose-phosphate 3-epimerase
MPDRPILISPSILSADMAQLATDIGQIEKAGADWVHVDVMDGRFVPNITIGIPVVKALKKHTGMPLDVHLMIVEPERYVEDFVKAGADWLTVQAESTYHLFRTLQVIRNLGAKAGVALNPATPISAIEHVLEEVDMVLVMTVEPGFGGQKFIPAMLPKIASLAELVKRRQLPVDIQVDGGINKSTIGDAAQAGAKIFVAGTAVFGAPDVTQAVKDLRAAV